MSKQNSQITAVALPVNTEASGQSSNIFKKYLYHWPLFVLWFIVFIAIAFLYLQIANPIYPILATIEFKSPLASSASLTVNPSSTEQELNPIEKPIIVENEIEVMQSKKIIYQVVNNLQLWVTYNEKQGLLKKDLYKDTPVKFKFLKQIGVLDPDGVKLKLTLNKDKTFSYVDYDDGDTKKIKFSSPVKNSFGTWELEPTANLSNFIDSTLSLHVIEPDEASDLLQKSIKVETETKDAPFVDLELSEKVPERGKDILNSIMGYYLQFSLEDKNKLSQKTLKFIDFRIDSLKDDLNAIEKQIEQFEVTHNISFSVDTEAQGFENVKIVNTKALNDDKVQLSVLDDLERYANSTDNSGKIPSVAVTGGNLPDPGLAALYDKLSGLQIQLTNLLSTTPPTNPTVISVNNQINTLKGDFKDKIESMKSSMLAQKKELESIISGAQSSLNNVPAEDRELRVLKRFQQSKETIYQFLLAKREQVALRYASTVSDSEIIDDAHAGIIKWPLIPVVYLLALILGFGTAAGILYLREYMNELIIARKQIEDETEVPILGELAYQNTDKQIVVSEGRSKFAIGEQFRVLRTNLYHLHGNNDSGRVTLFTSSVSGEGKSFASSNLAVTLAYASRKTIILEMDLRKPKVSVNFALSPEHPGISNYLSEENLNLNELIQPSGIAGLDVFSCGTIVPNPSELLEKDKLDEMISSLRKLYDEIIIDSPPIHLVTDALVIARVADASLYVVRQGYTHKYELEFISEINESKRFPKLSIIFNGVKSGASSYGGYSGYGYSGYNSSYNSYADKHKRNFGDVLKGILRRF